MAEQPIGGADTVRGRRPPVGRPEAAGRPGARAPAPLQGVPLIFTSHCASAVLTQRMAGVFLVDRNSMRLCGPSQCPWELKQHPAMLCDMRADYLLSCNAELALCSCLSVLCSTSPPSVPAAWCQNIAGCCQCVSAVRGLVPPAHVSGVGLGHMHHGLLRDAELGCKPEVALQA